MPDKKPLGHSRTSVSQSRSPPPGYVAAGYHLIKAPSGNGTTKKKEKLGRDTTLSVGWGDLKKEPGVDERHPRNTGPFNSYTVI